MMVQPLKTLTFLFKIVIKRMFYFLMCSAVALAPPQRIYLCWHHLFYSISETFFFFFFLLSLTMVLV